MLPALRPLQAHNSQGACVCPDEYLAIARVHALLVAFRKRSLGRCCSAAASAPLAAIIEWSCSLPKHFPSSGCWAAANASNCASTRRLKHKVSAKFTARPPPIAVATRFSSLQRPQPKSQTGALGRIRAPPALLCRPNQIRHIQRTALFPPRALPASKPQRVVLAANGMEPGLWWFGQP